jgi:hypothetical protein
MRIVSSKALFRSVVRSCVVASLVLLSLFLPRLCLAQTQPSTSSEPAETTTATAPAQPASSPSQRVTTDEAIAWLDKLEAQSKTTRTLKADLRYDRTQGLLGDRQRRFGSIVYESGPPARYAIHFTRVLIDRRSDDQSRWYIFDGQWLVEKLDDQKQFFAHEIVEPGTPPERANPLALGEGPFAVPIAAEKARILARFDAVVIPPADTDPKESVHLRLTPRPGVRINFTAIDLWYDRQTLAPLQARTQDESENISLIVLSKVQLNESADTALMDTRPPSAKGEQGWREELRPWGN